jgi:hypothetical protein
MKKTRRERKLLAEAEKSVFCWVFREFIRERGQQGYSAPATWILANLNERASTEQKNCDEWPVSANQAGVLLRKYRDGLNLTGVQVDYKRHGLRGRRWILKQTNAP